LLNWKESPVKSKIDFSLRIHATNYNPYKLGSGSSHLNSHSILLKCGNDRWKSLGQHLFRGTEEIKITRLAVNQTLRDECGAAREGEIRTLK